MAIDFCHIRHEAVISCNKVSADDYEASNLISEDEKLKRRGFLAASFISVPVEINIKFPYNIDISHIVLNLQNGAQQTKSCRLYTDTGIFGDKEDYYCLIGFYNDIVESTITLVNNRYTPNRLFSVFSCAKPQGQKLYPKSEAHVRNVRNLKVCLTKTANSSVPVLSRLEIWGQPGTNCSSEQTKNIYATEVALRNIKSRLLEHDALPSRDSGHRNHESKKVDDESMDVPAEFRDSLTFEIMSQPVLLPSGNNVDHSTLQKYIESSAVWGHLPGDPFTGMPFSKTSQPMPNIELKTRIDEFSFKHPDSCSGGRCIGVISKTKFQHDIPVHQTPKSKNSNPFPLLKTQAKRPASGLQARANTAPQQQGSKTSFPTAFKPKDRKKTAVPLSNHGKELAHSLKQSLQDVLKGRPSYLEVNQPPEVINNMCNGCKTVQINNTYILPCSHLLCRKCLLAMTSSVCLKCKECSLPFVSSDVNHYHL